MISCDKGEVKVSGKGGDLLDEVVGLIQGLKEIVPFRLLVLAIAYGLSDDDDMFDSVLENVFMEEDKEEDNEDLLN